MKMVGTLICAHLTQVMRVGIQMLLNMEAIDKGQSLNMETMAITM